jgi:hypothetical protein
MEEVAPLAVSTATLQTPAEAYKPAAHGEAKAEQEMTRWVGGWRVAVGLCMVVAGCPWLSVCLIVG